MLTAIVEAQLHAGTINLEHVRRLHDAMSITITAIVDHGTDLLDVLIPAKDLRDRASSAKKNESVWAENLRQLVAAEGILSNKLARKRSFSQITVVLRSYMPDPLVNPHPGRFTVGRQDICELTLSLKQAPCRAALIHCLCLSSRRGGPWTGW